MQKQVIDESISRTAFRRQVRAVIKFDGCDDSRGHDIGKDEINVLLRDAVGMAALPVTVRTGDDVCKANLARNLIAVANNRREDVEKRGFVPGQ